MLLPDLHRGLDFEANGTVAEGLGRGLQNLLQQFESARYLQKAVTYDSFYF